MILYPTETLYALGVNALDEQALRILFAVKGRDGSKAVSWLVRGAEDIARYAEMDREAKKLASLFLPGPLTLVLPAKTHVPQCAVADDGTVGFRVSSDAMAATLIDAYMTKYDAPLTCTSANKSGAPTLNTTEEILEQLGAHASLVTEVYDDGPRKGLSSTVVRIQNGRVEILREGVISEQEIREAVE